MEKIASDLKYAIRQLGKAPGFSITAVLMLAFGIGATTAIFSIVEAVILRPLPFPDSDRLMAVGDHLEGTTVSFLSVTVPDIKAYTRETHGFSALGGYQNTQYELSGSGEPAQINAARLTPGVFDALGVQPQLGRVFNQDEVDHNQLLAVLSYGSWVERFHRDFKVLDSRILLDRKPYIIIGVMPKGFEFPLVAGQLNRVELWVPMSYRPEELAPPAAGNWSYNMVGRLKPGWSPRQAQADAEVVAQEIMRGYPAMIASIRITAQVRPLQEDTIAQTRPMLRILFLAVAVVLLIACVNLAGLMLVRAIRRQREIAVRLALGARAAELLRQAIMESLVLSVSGGILGLILSAISMEAFISLLPETLPRIDEIGLNWYMVGFALALGIVTGLVCGLVPAFAALRTNVNANLKEGGRAGSEGGGHARLRSALVVAEIAVALVLLTASGLLLRSFNKMRDVNLGFQPQHVTTASYSLPQKQYAKQDQIDEFNRELLLRLNALPGATAAGITNLLPANGVISNVTFVVDGYSAPTGGNMNLASASEVLGNAFQALGIPILKGRFFTPDDRHGSQLVIIVNHKFAEHYWPGQDPIGKRIRSGTPEMQTPWMTVVGEVADVKLASPDEPSIDQYYVPEPQGLDDAGPLATADDVDGNTGYIVLRSTLPPEQMENSIRTAVRSLDPLLPLTQVQTMEQTVSQSESPRRFDTLLIGGFAAAAVVLAVLGIYSVIAFSVASRAQEMAIRLALGSPRGAIIQLVLRSGFRLGLIGCILGLGGAAAVSGLLRSLLFGISPFDPLVLTLAALGVLALSLAASWLPALRAAAVNPMAAIRGE